MRRPPFALILVAIVGLILAACASPSEGGPGASGGGGEPSTAAESDAPGESQDGGGGGGGGGLGGGSGSVQFQMTGGHEASGELPFAGNFAYFQQAGVTFLVFTDDTEATEANGVVITLGPEGSSEDSVFAYITEDLIIPVADCDWNVTRNDATGAAGSFTCNDATGFSGLNAAVSGIDISGDFEASN